MKTRAEKTTVASEADRLEQEEPAGAESIRELVDGPLDLGERPEADVLEQATPVVELQIVDRSAAYQDKPEADWLEQSIEEATEEQRR